MRRIACHLALVLLTPAASVQAQLVPERAVVFVDFAKGLADQVAGGGELQLHGATRDRDGHVEFTTASQYAEVGKDAMAVVARWLDGIKAMSVGGWFYPRRSGEQIFFSRGLPETGPLGERLFRPREDWVNFRQGDRSARLSAEHDPRQRPHALPLRHAQRAEDPDLEPTGGGEGRGVIRRSTRTAR